MSVRQAAMAQRGSDGVRPARGLPVETHRSAHAAAFCAGGLLQALLLHLLLIVFFLTLALLALPLFFCLFFSPPGNTETVAGYISAATGIDAQDIGDVGAGIADFDGIICGAPTWHTGADTERSGTVWDEFIYGELEGLDLAGKKVAIFGLGDSGGYGDNFCDAMDELATCFKARGAEIIGSVSTDGYEFEESKSVAGGKFIGLACDEDNQPDMSEERVGAWISQLKSEGMPL